MHSLVVDGGDGLQIWTVAADIFETEALTAVGELSCMKLKSLYYKQINTGCHHSNDDCLGSISVIYYQYISYA